jgi:membrane dipeptidase
MRRLFFPVLLLSSFLTFALAQDSNVPKTSSKAAAAKPAAKSASGKAANWKAVHNSSLIIDTHADTTQRLLDEDFDMSKPPAGDTGHLDFAKAKAGNLQAEFFSVWVDPSAVKKENYGKRTMQLIDAVYQQAEKNPKQMRMAFSTADILKAQKEKKFAALMGIEGGHSIQNDMGMLRDFYRLGVRYMTLTWSNTNEWADSSGDLDDKTVEHHQGMTQFGREVVREMNRLGMMVDISHVSDRTFYQALGMSRAPVIASHSSSRVLTNHLRNMTDDMLRAMNHNGGVVMVNFFSAFIDEDYRKAFVAQAPERKAAQDKLAEQTKDMDPKAKAEAEAKLSRELSAKIPRPPLKSLIDHIDHIAKVAGIDHVGIGSDFDGISSTPEGIDSAADLPKITEELMKRGYTATDIKKIMGGNIMRVFKQVEQMSAQIKAEGQQDPLLKRKTATK